MTLEEYDDQKKILEQKIKELEDKWYKENEDTYAVNAGKYYRSRSSDNTIGVVVRFCSGTYHCREITCDTDGLFIETLQEWSVSTLLSQFEFITRDEFVSTLKSMIAKLNNMANESFYL